MTNIFVSSEVISVESSTCDYSFLKSDESGNLRQCDTFTPYQIELCSHTSNGHNSFLYSNDISDYFLETGMGLTTTSNPDTDGYITPDNYLQLCGYNELQDMSLMMGHVDGSATFAWYGVNGGVEDTANPLVKGSNSENGVYLYPGNGLKSYLNYECLNIKSTNGNVLLSMIRYNCTAFTASTAKPTPKPTARPTVRPSFKPTTQPTECNYYFFAILTDSLCAPFPIGVTACAYASNGDSKYLYNTGYGLGIFNDQKAITCTDFIQLEGVNKLSNVGLDMYSQFQEACFTFYATNYAGQFHPSDPVVGQSCKEEVFIDLKDKYTNYKYVNIIADDCNYPVILANIVYNCI